MQLLKNNEAFKFACLFAGILCLLSLFPMPMLIFFSMARWIACLVGLWAIYVCNAQQKWSVLIAFLVIIVLLNPIAPILLPQQLSIALYIGALLAFCAASQLLRADALPPPADDAEIPTSLHS